MVTVTVEVSACERCPHLESGFVTSCGASEEFLLVTQLNKVHPRCPFRRQEDSRHE